MRTVNKVMYSVDVPATVNILRELWQHMQKFAIDGNILSHTFVAEIIAIGTYVSDYQRRREWQHTAMIELAKIDPRILEAYSPTEIPKYVFYDAPIPNEYGRSVISTVSRAWEMVTLTMLGFSMWYGIWPTIDAVIRNLVLDGESSAISRYMSLLIATKPIIPADSELPFEDRGVPHAKMYTNRIQMMRELRSSIRSELEDPRNPNHDYTRYESMHIPQLLINTATQMFVVAKREKLRSLGAFEYEKHYYDRVLLMYMKIIDLNISTRPIDYFCTSYELYRIVLRIVLGHLLLCSIDETYCLACMDILSLAVNIVYHGQGTTSRKETIELYQKISKLYDIAITENSNIYTFSWVNGVMVEIVAFHKGKRSVRHIVHPTFEEASRGPQFDENISKFTLETTQWPESITLSYRTTDLETGEFIADHELTMCNTPYFKEVD
jgi:hypothetical protein